MSNPHSRISKFWEDMTKTYPSTWLTRESAKPSQFWVGLFSNLSQQDLDRGIGNMLNDDRYVTFPPSVLEFRKLCEPSDEDLGLPAESIAFNQATGLRSGQRHPGLVWLLKQPDFDVHLFRTMSTKDAQAYFATHWQRVRDKVAEGFEFPEEVTALPNPAKKTSRNPEVMQEAMEMIRGILGKGPTRHEAIYDKDGQRDFGAELIARQERLAKARQYHELMLRNTIPPEELRTNHANSSECQYPGCRAVGTISNSLKGSEVWFCREHFREA